MFGNQKGKVGTNKGHWDEKLNNDKENDGSKSNNNNMTSNG